MPRKKDLNVFLRVLKEIDREFEEVQEGLESAPEAWTSSKGELVHLPTDFTMYLNFINGLRRVKDDKYFTFRIVPVSEFTDYFSFQRYSEAEDLNATPDLYPGDRASNCILFGGEGEFGVYVLNCTPGSPRYGHVYCIVNNVPERTAEWPTFTAFFGGLPEYCRVYPLEKYKEELPGSSPCFGYAFKRNIVVPQV